MNMANRVNNTPNFGKSLLLLVRQYLVANPCLYICKQTEKFDKVDSFGLVETNFIMWVSEDVAPS